MATFAMAEHLIINSMKVTYFPDLPDPHSWQKKIKVIYTFVAIVSSALAFPPKARQPLGQITGRPLVSFPKSEECFQNLNLLKSPKINQQ